MEEEEEAESENTLKIEAEEVVKEVAFAVQYVEMSKNLEQKDENAFMNIQTKEGNKYCVELSVQGFRVIGRQFDTNNENEYSGFYETIYAMLDKLSPEYRNSFGEALLQKLKSLEEDQGNDAS